MMVPGAVPLGYPPLPFRSMQGVPVPFPGMGVPNNGFTLPNSAAGYPPTEGAAASDPHNVLPEDDSEPALETECNARFNVEEMLADIITNSEYFRSLFKYGDWEHVLNEFLKHAKNIESRIPGLSRKASTAFCCLYKLLSMKLSETKVKILLDHDVTLVRCLGILYLRYILKPQKMWQYFEPILDDTDEVIPGADGLKTTVGLFAAKCLKDIRYYGTTFPRIPKTIQLIFNRELIRREILRSRDDKNEYIRDDLDVGTKIQAQYPEDWALYDAIIDEVMDNGKFLVTFEGYDDQEEVSIGMIRLKERRKRRRSRSRSHSRSRRSRDSSRHRDRSRDRSRKRRRVSRDRKKDRSSSNSIAGEKQDDYPLELTNDNLDLIIKQREQRGAHAVGKNYARPPVGLKRGLSIKAEVATTRRTSRSRSPGPRRRPRKKSVRKAPRVPQKKAPSEAHLVKMAALMKKYGCDDSTMSKTF